jgi:RNA exonuclease 4
MAFFTKKQKASMRERKKKQKLLQKNKPPADPTSAENSEKINSTKKRPRVDDDADAAFSSSAAASVPNTDPNLEEIKTELTTKRMAGTLYVLIPSDLSTKDSKKFRKDARRQLRQEPKKNNNNDDDGDENEIEFVTKEDMPSLKPSKKKQKKKEFACINDLLKQQKQDKVIKKEESRIQGKLDSIPECVRAKYVALDCEMVGIGTGGVKSALARVSLVDWNMNVLLDTFVQVPIRVTDFRTHVSGVEAKHLKSSTAMPVKQCRDQVAKLLKGKILCGHGLTNDFKALMMSHPKESIRDTAKYRPFQRYGNGKWRPRKLRDLVKENLKGKDGFQEGEHDSIQDAKASMELFQVVFSQWEKELENKTR